MSSEGPSDEQLEEQKNNLRLLYKKPQNSARDEVIELTWMYLEQFCSEEEIQKLKKELEGRVSRPAPLIFSESPTPAETPKPADQSPSFPIAPKHAEEDVLLEISLEEWRKAEQYFRENPKADKLFKKADPDYPQEEGARDKSKHSFIKLEFEENGKKFSKIFALANGEYLGKGSFGKVKIVKEMVKQGEKYIEGPYYAAKIEDFESDVDHENVDKIMKMVGALIASKTIKSKKGKDKRVTLMPFLKGKTLQESFLEKVYMPNPQNPSERIFKTIKRKEEITETQALITALKCAMKVQELHNNGIIHADLKPLNFMSSLSGNDILIAAIDYGFSMLLKENEDVIVGSVKGTLHYMAPETQRKGLTDKGKRVVSWGEYSFASDVFALGKMFEDMGIPKSIYIKMVEPNPKDRIPLTSVIKNLLDLLMQMPDPDENTKKVIKECVAFLASPAISAKKIQKFFSQKPEVLSKDFDERLFKEVNDRKRELLEQLPIEDQLAAFENPQHLSTLMLRNHPKALDVGRIANTVIQLFEVLKEDKGDPILKAQMADAYLNSLETVDLRKIMEADRNEILYCPVMQKQLRALRNTLVEIYPKEIAEVRENPAKQKELVSALQPRIDEINEKRKKAQRSRPKSS